MFDLLFSCLCLFPFFVKHTGSLSLMIVRQIYEYRIEKSILTGLCWNVHDSRNLGKIEMLLLFCKSEGCIHLDLSWNKQILNTRKTTLWYIELYPSWSTWWLEAIISILAISEQQQCKRKLIVYTAVIRCQLQITLKLPLSNWFCVFKPNSQLLPPLPWLFEEDIFCTP